MVEQVQEQPTALDTVKLVAGIAIIAAGIAAFYVFGEQPIWLRWLMVLFALVVGLVVGFQSKQGKDLWQFIQNSRVELRKVVWPTRDETTKVTILVFVVVVVMGLFFWGLDWALGSMTRWLTGRGA